MTIQELKQRYWLWRENLGPTIGRFIFRWTHFGDACQCNLCGWKGSKWYTLQYGPAQAANVCSVCLGHSRHRLTMLAMLERSIPPNGARVLHVAPKNEFRFERFFRQRAKTYTSIDVEEGMAMLQMDLLDLKFADGSFDFISCCHVLEHIADDQRAIQELYRVLAPNGIAFLQVPIYGEHSEPVQVPRADDDFHVWHPGKDYHQRYFSAGFQVEDLSCKVWPTDKVDALGLMRHEDLALCKKAV